MKIAICVSGSARNCPISASWAIRRPCRSASPMHGGWLPVISPCCSWVTQEPARSSLPARSIMPARAPTSPLSKSIALPCQRVCLSRSFSATSAGLSPARWLPSRADSSRPMAGPCFWMRSASCRWRCRPSCYGYCRIGWWCGSAAGGSSNSTCGWWPRPIATCQLWWRRASFGSISTIACRCCRCGCRRFANVPTTCRSWCVIWRMRLVWPGAVRRSSSANRRCSL